MNPLISIIIPTYNRADIISETLDSILNQTYQNWECIVVDDGSTDATADVMNGYLQKDSRFKYCHRPQDRRAGGNGARNYGFEICRGDYVQWFDSDDIMFSRYLEARIALFMDHCNLDVAFCAFSYFDVRGVQNRISNKQFSGDIIEDFVDDKILLGPQAYLLKKKILKNIQFDEKLKRAQDADFFFRVFTQFPNLKIIHTSQVLYSVRKHQESISSANDPCGIKLNSRFIVNKRILKYFHGKGLSKGTQKFKAECLHDLKRLLENKNYRTVVFSILNFEFLRLDQKLYLLFCTFTQYSFGRGANQFKKLKRVNLGAR